MKTLILFLLCIVGSQCAPTFRFAVIFGNDMVLQGGQAYTIWGHGKVGSKVDVTVGSTNKGTATVGNDGLWVAKMNSMKPGFQMYEVTATDGTDSIKLTNVLFGDVWVCGGQSNMQFAVDQAFNATKEIAAADNYPHIRFFTVKLVQSNTPLQDQSQPPEQPWSIASSKTITNGHPWTYFSATCWFFARDLFDHRPTIPLGMIASNWGGTPDEAWSSPEALKKCGLDTQDRQQEGTTTDFGDVPSYRAAVGGPSAFSVLWNAMIVPLLRSTIYGAVWYQGEADCNPTHGPLYHCTFPAMIESWRTNWHTYSLETSNAEFPFGFVQLSTWSDKNNSTVGTVPVVRWGQTANYGYVPNPSQKNVFMAVAVDLGDPGSPFGDIHPRYKQQVGTRLSNAARAVAYDDKSVYWSGPLVSTVRITDPKTVTVTFRSLGSDGIKLHEMDGFELCYDQPQCTQMEGTAGWAAAPVLRNDRTDVEISITNTTHKPLAVRYEWRQAPCHVEKGIEKCAVYSGGLPSPPFWKMLPA